MARVVLIAAVIVLFVQLASSQSPCDIDDFRNQSLLSGQCNDGNVCRNPCRGYFYDFINACGASSGQIITPNLVRSMHA